MTTTLLVPTQLQLDVTQGSCLSFPGRGRRFQYLPFLKGGFSSIEQ